MSLQSLKCEICGKESPDWSGFVFRWERDLRRMELRGFGVRCLNERCFPRVREDGVAEGWDHANNLADPAGLAVFLDSLLFWLGSGFRIDKESASKAARFLSACLAKGRG